MDRRKADSLSLRQEETVRAIEENSRATVSAILESRDLLRRDLQGLKTDLIAPVDDRNTPACSSPLVSLGRAQAVEIHLLLSLRFPSMPDRQAEIPVAHQKTYRWIFSQQSNSGEVSWSNFSHWLRAGEGIYWVSGKAGSGKSTLMRYVFENAETRKQLQVWAGAHHLESHRFFFWNGGSSEQRSQWGLLRSLLYQALYKRPDLVRDIFPDEIAANSAHLARKEDEKWNWTLPILKRAFQRWVDLALKLSINLCIFLDGLDEYVGDHDNIVDFFKSLSSLHPSRIKLCISSRPWIVFDEAFKGLPRLRLQDLTYRDIEVYVHDELRSHPRMVQLAEEEPEHAHELVTEIVTKASGVFLWVMLIIRSLLNGLRNRDDIAVLRKRLRHLPGDLSSLYTHMLDHVDPFYNEQASQTFQIYGALSNESDSFQVTVLELSLAITATPHIQTSVTSAVTDAEVKAHCENLDVHLKTRCAGLLEIHQGRLGDWDSPIYFDPVTPTHKVNYLHRTVKDFLATDDVQEKILNDCTSEFNPHTYIIHSSVTRLYRSIFITHIGQLCPASNEAVWATIVRAMKYAKCADVVGDRSYIAALAALEQAGKHAWNFGKDPWKGENSVPSFFDNTTLAWSSCDKQVLWTRNFIGEAIIHRLFAYINESVKESEKLLQAQAAMPFLAYAFQQRQPANFESPSTDVVSLLFQQGADPNHKWKGRNMLQKLCEVIRGDEWKSQETRTWATKDRVVKEKERLFLSELGLVLKLFLQYEPIRSTLSSDGMYRRVSHGCHNAKNERSISKIISEIYEKYLPSMKVELLDALDLWRSGNRQPESTNGTRKRQGRDDSYSPRKRHRGSNHWNPPR